MKENGQILKVLLESLAQQKLMVKEQQEMKGDMRQIKGI